MEKERGDASIIDLLKKLSTVTILFINLLISREFQEYSLYKSILNYRDNYSICQLEKIFFELYTIF